MWGTKLDFCTKRKDSYLKAAETKGLGDFYTKVAQLYELKYGFDLKDDQDMVPDVPDPADEEANKVVHKRDSPEEEEKQKLHKALHSVSVHSCQLKRRR